MQKRLASVHSILGRGSLIPLPNIDVGETSQIKQQAFRVTMTFMVLRITIFKMKEIWRLHAKKDMYKRLASVHSKVRRGSLIPLPIIDVGETSQIKQQAIRVIMTLMALQNATFSIIEIWQHCAKMEKQKRLAYVHSIIGRGSQKPPSPFCVTSVCHFKASLLYLYYIVTI